MLISDWSSDVCSSDLSASAHHANIKGSTDCGGLVSWTASSWSNADGAGDNADVRVDYQLDGAGAFQPVPSGSPGSFDTPGSSSFSGTFTAPGSPDSVTLRVTAVADWGHGAAGGQTRSEEHTSELQSLMRMSNAAF